MEAAAFTDLTTESFVNWTTASPHPEPKYSIAVGFIAVGVAALMFGSNLLPVKKFETGDGLFFQWIYCTNIWIVGFIVNIAKGFPVFHPLAMLGGFLWCTGNVLTVPIIRTVGLSQGILIWAAVNMLSGWASDRFGWFGLEGSIPNSTTVNYIGVTLCLISAFVYMFLKTTATSPPPEPSSVSFLPISDSPNNSPDSTNDNVNSAIVDFDSKNQQIFYERLPPVPKRIFGTVAAVVAGFLFGLNFVPVIYVQDNCLGASSDGLDYVFSHFTGIFASSTVYLLIYCAVMCNRPRIYPQIILPGAVSGIMWGIAGVCWFIANDALSPPVSFPIITSLPAIIGAMWGMFAFGEIRGRKNYIVLVTAIIFAVMGSVLTGLSKSEVFGKAPEPAPYAKMNCTNPIL